MCICLAADDGASGWSERTSWRVGGLDPGEPAREASEIAERTRGAAELEPGTYAAVLEPYAVAELARWFSYDSMGAQGYLEERSYFCGRIGEQPFDSKISIADDALDTANLPKAFDFEGVPKQRVQMIEDGVIRDVVWDRATAARAEDGRASTGHAPPDAWRFYGPLPTAFSMPGGEAGSTEELAELVGDGIYVTRLHYLSVVEPRAGILTGMTRDGTFRIRDGKVAEPLVNLRFTVAMSDVLAEVPGLAREPMLVNLNDLYDERFPHAALVPALATKRFHITGTGSGPGSRAGDASRRSHEALSLLPLSEQVVEDDRVGEEDRADDDRQPRQIPLDDVGSTLRGRHVAHPGHAGVATRVHEDQRDQGNGRDEVEEHDCRQADAP